MASTFDPWNAFKCELVADVLRAYGTVRLPVTGRSMFPSVRRGDVLVVDRIHCCEVAHGDIVLFAREQRLVAHRVVEKSGTELLTRGDAVSAPDGPVGADDLLGRVSFIVRGGKYIRPRKTLRFAERGVGMLLRRSQVAARVIAGIHGLLQSQVQTA